MLHYVDHLAVNIIRLLFGSRKVVLFSRKSLPATDGSNSDEWSEGESKLVDHKTKTRSWKVQKHHSVGW